MSPTRTLLLYGSLALFANVIPTQQALAVALRPNKTTDDSVCDLTHHTNLYLGSKTLVPSVAQTKDKVDAYFRLAGEFVASKCKNGQLLMVRGLGKQRRYSLPHGTGKFIVRGRSNIENRGDTVTWRSHVSWVRVSVHDPQARRTCRQTEVA